jgi:unspecific monooxygenase
MLLNDWGGQTFPHLTGRKPVIGDVGSIRARTPLQSVMQQCADLGPIFELRVFGQKFVFVAGADLAAEMSDERRFEKALSPALVALREFAGAGLFTAYNDETDWALAHTLLMPAFTKAAMRRYHPIMLQVAGELFESWQTPARVDVAADMTRLTLETISRAAFSTDFGSFTRDEPHPFVPAMIAALTAGQRKGSLATMPGAGLLARRIERRTAHHQAFVDDLLDGIIAERRAEHPGDDAERDLLGIMLHASHPDTGARLDDLNIRHQILTFLVAGHETTSGALSFALHHLARNPDVLATAQAEVDEVLGRDRTVEPTFEQVPRLRHVRRVLDEALRLWPTAPAYTRTPREDLVLSTGHTMRPGDWAIVLLPLVHRDPAAWGDDAADFDPDRFDRSRGRTPPAYKPFGTGERACIGRQFALHEAVLVLAMVLHRYDLAGDPGYELRVTERLTLMPEGLELSLTRR